MNVGIPLPTRHGWGMVAAAVPLCTLGILTIHATSTGEGSGIVAPLAARQIAFAVAGVVVMLGALVIGYHRFGRLSYALFAAAVSLLALLIVDRWMDLPMVVPQRNARRWIRIGPTQVQPSELMKIAYVLSLAWYLRYRRNYRTVGGLVAPFAMTLVPMGLILLQPDLGTVMLFLPVLFAMLFAAGAKIRHLAVVIALGLACAPAFWMKIAPYQRLRITGVLLQSASLRDYLSEPPRWLDGRPSRWDYLRPESEDAAAWRRKLDNWASDDGYQLVRSKTAIASGGPLGQGWGQGIFVDYNFLPEKHNDVIFAIVAHQWGLPGSLTVVLCYAVLVVLAFDIAARTHEPFGRLIAVGLATMVAVQTLTNLCMTVGLGPITGVTLPFVSAGGSSLLASFLTIGLLISVDQRRPVLIAHPPFEFSEQAGQCQTC